MTTQDVITRRLLESGRAVVQVETDEDVLALYQMIYRIERQNQVSIGRLRVDAAKGHFVFLWIEEPLPPTPGDGR